MAVLRCEADFDISPIKQLVNIFPDLGGRYLALVGKRGGTQLKKEFLSGQELNLTAYPRARDGRNTITYGVNKKKTAVAIRSFPVNLFEKGRMLRSGRKEPGRYIITRKLKQSVTSRLGSYATEFETRVLNPEIKKVGL